MSSRLASGSAGLTFSAEASGLASVVEMAGASTGATGSDAGGGDVVEETGALFFGTVEDVGGEAAFAEERGNLLSITSSNSPSLSRRSISRCCSFISSSTRTARFSF